MQESLRDYLHRTEFETLIEVVQSLGFEKQIEAIGAMVEFNKGFPAFEDRAKLLALDANMYHFMSEKLKELKSQTAPFTTANATP